MHKKTTTKKILLTIFSAIALVGVLMVGICLWLYSGKLTQAKISVFYSIPFPIASVEGKYIPANRFLFRYNVGKRLANKNLSPKNSDLVTSSFDQLIADEKQKILAKKLGVYAGQKEIDSEFETRVSAWDLEGKKDHNELLKSYGFTAFSYKDQIIAPQILSINLQIWYNSNRELNSKSYLQAEDLKQRISQGEDMALLAKAFSQDEAGKATGGDLGFSDIADLLIELREPVSNMKIMEAKVLPSRYGLQIIRIEEQQGNKIKLRQIFLENSGFNGWINQETKNFKIKTFISPASLVK